MVNMAESCPRPGHSSVFHTFWVLVSPDNTPRGG